MSNVNTLALRTLDDDDLMDVVGGCGGQSRCNPEPCHQYCPPPQPCEIKIDLCVSLGCL